MKILIEIRCDSPEEVFEHLQEIKRQLKKEFKTWDVVENDFQFEDANCYGEHDVYCFTNEDISLAIDESQVKKGS